MPCECLKQQMNEDGHIADQLLDVADAFECLLTKERVPRGHGLVDILRTIARRIGDNAECIDKCLCKIQEEEAKKAVGGGVAKPTFGAGLGSHFGTF